MHTNTVIIRKATVASKAEAWTTWVLHLAVRRQDNDEYALVVGQLIVGDALVASGSRLRSAEGNSDCRGSGSGGGYGCNRIDPIAGSICQLKAADTLRTSSSA